MAIATASVHLDRQDLPAVEQFDTFMSIGLGGRCDANSAFLRDHDHLLEWSTTLAHEVTRFCGENPRAARAAAAALVGARIPAALAPELQVGEHAEWIIDWHEVDVFDPAPLDALDQLVARFGNPEAIGSTLVCWRVEDVAVLIRNAADLIVGDRFLPPAAIGEVA